VLAALESPWEVAMETILYTFILFLTLGLLFFAVAFRETPKIPKK
jgi:photosystem II PsbT protein